MFTFKWSVMSFVFRGACNTLAEAHFIYSALMDTKIVTDYHLYKDAEEIFHKEDKDRVISIGLKNKEGKLITDFNKV